MDESNIAGLGRRILGGLIDFILFIVIGVSIGILISPDTVQSSSGSASVTIPNSVALPVAIVTFIVLFIVMEGKYGKTPGKFVVGTKVVTEDFAKITMKQSIIRNLLRIIDAQLIYIVAIIIISIDKKNQRLGDLVAKTLVVRDQANL